MRQLAELPFINDVEAKGGVIYSVGGAVRDEILKKESKDLDVLVCKVEYVDLIKILEKYGQVDLVGKSFGIIKFTEHGETESIDIALPRTERKTGEGHKAFEVTVDPYLPLEDDLRRRDFTINAMARTVSGQLIDPFDGLTDIKTRQIRMVDKVAFSDDPLRMLRAVQFASRFDFEIEPGTLDDIINNVTSIRKISAERIVEEFKKIVEKGDCEMGARLLHSTGLYKTMFKDTYAEHLGHPTREYKYVKTLPEFLFLLGSRNYYYKALIMAVFPNEVELSKRVQQLLDFYLYRYSPTGVVRVKLFELTTVWPDFLDTDIFTTDDNLTSVLLEFKSQLYPKNLSEVNIDGRELLDLGLQGKDIGDMLRLIVKKIMCNTLRNDNGVLIDFVKKERGIQ